MPKNKPFSIKTPGTDRYSSMIVYSFNAKLLERIRGALWEESNRRGVQAAKPATADRKTA